MVNDTCLLCFTVNRRSYNIHNTHLQTILKRFTNSKIMNVKCYLLCFICYTRLKQTYQLLQMAEKADKMLQSYLMDKTNEKIPPRKSLVELSISNVTNTSIIPVVKYEASEGETRIERGSYARSCEIPECEEDDIRNTGDITDMEENVKQEIDVEDFTGISGNYDFEDFSMEDSFHSKTNSEQPTKLEKTTNENNERKLFQCDTCNGQFKDKDKLKDHVLTHLSKSLSCRVCARPYRHRYLLIRHERSHARQKQYTCNVCKRRYAHRASLKTHQLLHTGDKPFVCGVCQRSFTQKGSLKSHMRTHTGEKPFSCDHCEKKFRQGSSLNAHLRTHTGERPFICDICNRDFSQPHVLKEHRRIHTGEKPYACDVCHVRFPNHRGLKTHKKSHHE